MVVRVRYLVLFRQFHLGDMERKQLRMIVWCLAWVPRWVLAL